MFGAGHILDFAMAGYRLRRKATNAKIQVPRKPHWRSYYFAMAI